MTTADLPIAIDREVIARFCRERGIRSLSLFGSILCDDFDPARSDIDVLAEFAPGALRGVGLRYFGFAEELGAIPRSHGGFLFTTSSGVSRLCRAESLKAL